MGGALLLGAAVAVFGLWRWRRPAPRIARPADVVAPGDLEIEHSLDAAGRLFTREERFRLRIRGAPGHDLDYAVGGRPGRATLAVDGRAALEIQLSDGDAVPVDLEVAGAPVRSFVVVRDAQPPRVELVSPTARVFTADATVDVVVRVREEHLAEVRCGGRRLSPGKDGEWVLAFADLPREGEHVLRIEAVDRAGNRGEVELTGYRDTRPPALVSAIPAPGAKLARVETVRAEMEFDEHLGEARLGRTQLEVDGRRATGSVPWHEFAGGAMTLLARDVVGNETRQELRFELVQDRTPPLLTLAEDVPTLTRSAQVVVAVRIEDSSPVRVRFSGVDAVAAGELWEARVPLDEGPNRILVDAIDSAGNAAELELVVVRDSRGPALVAAIPVSGDQVTMGREVAVELRFDEPVTAVDLGGTPLAVEGMLARGAVTLPSADAPVTLELEAEDGAGNRSRAQYALAPLAARADAAADPDRGVDFAAAPASELGRRRVRLETSRGTIELELWPDAAPQHVRNFLSLCASGFYDGTTFHRVIDGFMIQGGDPTGSGTGQGPRKLEPELGPRKHVRGVLSMARGKEPGSASCQFFIVQRTSPHLDGAYTAFGRVTAGMEVVDAIAGCPRDARDRPLEPQVILHAVVFLAEQAR